MPGWPPRQCAEPVQLGQSPLAFVAACPGVGHFPVYASMMPCCARALRLLGDPLPRLPVLTLRCYLYPDPRKQHAPLHCFVCPGSTVFVNPYASVVFPLACACIDVVGRAVWATCRGTVAIGLVDCFMPLSTALLQQEGHRPRQLVNTDFQSNLFTGLPSCASKVHTHSVVVQQRGRAPLLPPAKDPQPPGSAAGAMPSVRRSTKPPAAAAPEPPSLMHSTPLQSAPVAPWPRAVSAPGLLAHTPPGRRPTQRLCTARGPAHSKRPPQSRKPWIVGPGFALSS